MYLVLGSLVNVFDSVTVVGVVDVVNVIGVPSVLSRFTPCSQCLITQIIKISLLISLYLNTVWFLLPHSEGIPLALLVV